MAMPEMKGPRKISDLTCIIMAGGKSSRMGSDKALLKLGGMTLIERSARQAAKVFERVVISGPPSLGWTGFRAIPDDRPPEGPLMGLLSVMRTIDSPWFFTLPCDSPFVPEAFLRGMAGLREGVDAVVPMIEDYYEPLHALYSRSLREEAERFVAEGERQILRLFERARTRVVGPELLFEWDPRSLAFFNVNYPGDLIEAEEILQGLTREGLD